MSGHIATLQSILPTLALLVVTLVSGLAVFHLYAKFAASNFKLGDHLIVKDNAAVLITMAGFIGALFLATIGSYYPDGKEIGADFELAGGTLIVSIAVLIISFLVNEFAILWHVDNTKEVFEKGNLAVAVVQFATFVATAFIWKSSMQDASHDTAFNAVWSVIGQLLLIAMGFLYYLCNKTVFQKIKDKSLASGFSLAGFLLSGGIFVGSSIHRGGSDWNANAQALGISLLIWITVMALVRGLIYVFIAKHSRLTKELAVDNNIGLGFLDGLLFVVFTFGVVFVHAYAPVPCIVVN